MTEPAFDVLAYARTAQGRFAGELHAGAYPDGVPGPDLAPAIDWLARRLGSTPRWLSRVLVTPTHADARITAFLSAWAVERHWSAEALHAVAGAVPAPADRHPGTLGRAGDRFGPLGEAVLSNLHGTALTAVHMAERAIDARLLDVLLLRAATRSGDGALARDLERIRAVGQRSTPFFLESAHERLAAQPAARRLARRRLARRVWPIGADREPAAATAAALLALVGSETAWAEALDAEFDALPGLAGLRLMARTAANPGHAALRSIPRPNPEHPGGRTRRKDSRG